VKSVQEETKRAPAQPIEAASVPGAMLRIATVTAITGLSKRTIYRMMAAGEFPKSVHLSPRCTAWRQGDVAEWLTGLAESGKVQES
jgi:prophage regulatory protein